MAAALAAPVLGADRLAAQNPAAPVPVDSAGRVGRPTDSAGGGHADSGRAGPALGDLQAAPSFASPLVPADHWSRAAARRLQTLGLAPAGYEAGLDLLTRRELALVFAASVERAERERPEYASLARGYRDRFAEEFGDAGVPEPPDAAPVRLLHGWAGAGYGRSSGGVRAGFGYDNRDDWTGARPVPDTSAAMAAASIAGRLGAHVALRVVPELRGDAVGIGEGEVVATWRALGAWAGRRIVGFGPARAGGIVLSGREPLDGFGVFLAKPIRFPWIFRHMGPIRIETFLSRVEGGDTSGIRDPFFVAFRGTMTPHPRFTAGLNRAAMFGGRGNDPWTLRNLSFLLLGGTRSGERGEFANDVLSADFQFRPPLGPVPLQLYLEWGMDDSAGAWLDVPGMTAGAELGAVPGLPWASLGGEWTWFARSCCGNSIWYRNWAMRQGWTDEGRLLGHELGGQGTEWLAYGSIDGWDARLRLRGTAFLRERGAENLLAPERAGRSRGGSVSAAVRVGRTVELRLDADGERGSGWSAWGLRAGARALF